jgi:hypothetical protein
VFAAAFARRWFIRAVVHPAVCTPTNAGGGSSIEQECKGFVAQPNAAGGRYASSLLGASSPAHFAAQSRYVGLARAGAWCNAFGQVGSALLAVLARCVGPASGVGAAFGFASVLGVSGGKQNAGNPASTSMLALRSLTLRSNGPLSVPRREAGSRMFHLAPGYYKGPLNSTLGFLRTVVASCVAFRADVSWR